MMTKSEVERSAWARVANRPASKPGLHALVGVRRDRSVTDPYAAAATVLPAVGRGSGNLDLRFRCASHARVIMESHDSVG